MAFVVKIALLTASVAPAAAYNSSSVSRSRVALTNGGQPCAPAVRGTAANRTARSRRGGHHHLAVAVYRQLGRPERLSSEQGFPRTREPVFAGLCRDIIVFTRTNVADDTAAAVILSRVDRWRRLLQGELRGLSESELRGLIGELVVLETELLPALPAIDAVTAWNGPFGAAQDFTLPNGQRIEAKALRRDASSCRINGLSQLDPGPDTLVLAVVRLDQTGADADGAISATRLVNRLRDRLLSEPFALNELDSRLAAAGWQEHPDHDRFAVRLLGIERHAVDSVFPRLIRSTVPGGVLEADYEIALPPALGAGDAGAGDRA